MSTLFEQEASSMPPTELALTVPEDMKDVVANASQFEIAAQQYTVNSEPSFQVADQIQTSLKAEAKAINDKRLEFTRPIDAIKKKWMEFFALAVDGRIKAATIYQQKMSVYRQQQRTKAIAAQQAAEDLLRQQQQAELQQAQKLRDKAATLKTDAARDRALAEAEQIETAAQMMPTTVALSTPEPQTIASNVAQIWELETVADMPRFLRWLSEHPEWHGVISFQKGEMNRMAKQFRDVVPVPGIKFHSKDSFRTKSR